MRYHRRQRRRQKRTRPESPWRVAEPAGMEAPIRPFVADIASTMPPAANKPAASSSRAAPTGTHTCSGGPGRINHRLTLHSTPSRPGCRVDDRVAKSNECPQTAQMTGKVAPGLTAAARAGSRRAMARELLYKRRAGIYSPLPKGGAATLSRQTRASHTRHRPSRPLFVTPMDSHSPGTQRGTVDPRSIPWYPGGTLLAGAGRSGLLRARPAGRRPEGVMYAD